jgi:signal transduction histidine kinase
MRTPVDAGSTSGSNAIPELAVQRAIWRTQLLTVVRPVAAVLSALGFMTVSFVVKAGQHLLPMVAFVLLFLVAVLPGIRLRMRTWLIALGLPGTCILSISEFGLAPNLFSGLLLSIVSIRLLFDLRRSLVISAIIGVGLLVMCVSFILGWSSVGPSWIIAVDPTHPSNVVRIFGIFGAQAIATLLVLGYVLGNMEVLLVEKAAAIESLRTESAAKEKLRRELAEREKADVKARELEQLGRVASFFGHDTNNALQVIWSSLSVLRASNADAADRKAALGTLEDAATQIRTISMQLRAFGPGRSQGAGNSELHRVLEATVRMLAQVFPKEIEIVLAAPAVATVAIAEGELQRILINLAMNARDAMESRGRLTIQSWLSNAGGTPAGAPGSHVAIEMTDTGAGIAEALQAKVFEPFFTTKGEKGTGLGLASVRESVEASGGTVKLQSEPGKGTTVTIVLPVVLTRSISSQARSKRSSAGRVLVVEEPVVRGTLLRALRTQGLTAIAADTVADGLAALRDTAAPFSMLVLGSTAESEAEALLREFRRHAPDGQVIFLCEDEETSCADASDGITTLLKPFTLPELLHLIESRLGARSAVD